MKAITQLSTFFRQLLFLFKLRHELEKVLLSWRATGSLLHWGVRGRWFLLQLLRVIRVFLLQFRFWRRYWPGLRTWVGLRFLYNPFLENRLSIWDRGDYGGRLFWLLRFRILLILLRRFVEVLLDPLDKLLLVFGSLLPIHYKHA